MKERLDSLNTALTSEIREREFYLNNARRTNNPVGKAMFAQIADEELEHYERLKQLSDSLKEKGKWPATVSLKVKNTVIRDVFMDVIKKVRDMPAGDADDLEAIRTAIDFEAKGAAFYARISNEVKDPAEKAFFALLSSIEQEHYASLRDTEEYLTNPAAWFQKTERSLLDGA